MRRHRSMLMPDQLPSADFMAKGAASFVPITNSRCGTAAASPASGVCAQHGAANSVNAPVNAAIVADICIVARSGTPATRKNSIAHSRVGHRIARATPLEGDLRPARPGESQYKTCADSGYAAAKGPRLTECRHRLRGISLQLRISFLRARRQIFSRNGTMLYCRERDRVLFVATRARLSA